MLDSLRQLTIRLCSRLAAITIFSVFATHSFGAGETVLFTEGTQPLVTFRRELEIPSPDLAPLLTFQFGFSTEEIFQPGDLFDSFSVLIESAASGRTGFLLTADASGIVWAPAIEGGFQLDPGAIVRRPVPFADVQPALGNRSAYEVSFTLPEAFVGDRLNVVFDLFDNQNSSRSLGYFSDLRVVPEPSTGAILALGAVLALCFTRFFKKS